MAARFARSLHQVAALGLAIAVACTGKDPECEDDEVLVDGECVPAETDSDTVDSDTDVPISDETSRVIVRWDIEAVPNDNLVELVCDGRQVFEDGPFTARKTYERIVQVEPGSSCEVVLSDGRGGLTPAGEITVCTAIRESWNARRTVGARTVGEVDVPPCVRGCTDPVAENYDEDANFDIGSCQYIFGCTDPEALNYDRTATKDNGSCDFGGFGVVEADIFTDAYSADTTARIDCNGFTVASRLAFTPNNTFTIDAVVDGGFECSFIITDALGDRGAGGAVRVCGREVGRVDFVEDPDPPAPPLISFEPYEAVVASWKMPVCSGCTNPLAPEYDPDALIDDGSCTTPDF